MRIKEFQHQPVKPDTYEASMALNQLMRIGKHAIKLHNMIDDAAEMESWVAKKIDLAGDYVKKVYNYTEGEKAGLYDDGGMTEDKGSSMASRVIRNYAREIGADSMDYGMFMKSADLLDKDMLKSLAQHIDNSDTAPREYVMKKIADHDPDTFKKMYGDQEGYLSIMKPQKDLTDAEDNTDRGMNKYGLAARNKDGKFYSYKQGKLTGTFNNIQDLQKHQQELIKDESVSEDAGEGHMSKSTLYHTAKYAIALTDMIKPGDDLEGWVQSKLNKAADYLQGVYNYEEYQKLNPYREELDASLMQKHAQVVQKNIDEILSKETKLDDIDTKPGMMRILSKRVNEVEKEIAKETRKKTDESGILYRAGVKKYGKAGMKAIQSAAGKGASHQDIGKIKDKHLKDAEDLEEGLKDWARNLAAAGVIVGAVAGMGSIQNAIDNTVPAVKAMNTAYEMAIDAGNDELAKNIKNDISAVKVRLDSGKDLNFVKSMQEKYAKFIQTEGLAYESRLQVQLNQQLK